MTGKKTDIPFSAHQNVNAFGQLGDLKNFIAMWQG